MVEVEVCVDSSAGLRVADAAGAGRIELCSALSSGGLTPSWGLMALAGQCKTPVYAMIRPRAGDFIFNDDDVDIMLHDIARAREAGLAGVVLGASTSKGRLDLDVLTRLMEASSGMGRTLHRVFDLMSEPLEALEQAVTLGFERILTSGCELTAIAGKDMLRTLTARAGGRISIMAGSGVNASNATALVKYTGVREVHSSCRTVIRHEGREVHKFGFGDNSAETDFSAVIALRAAVASA